MSRSATRGSAAFGVLLAAALVACAPGGDSPSPSAAPSETESSAPDSVTPSITREVPPEQRRALGEIPVGQLCGLVTVGQLDELGVSGLQRGKPREVGFEPPARGCSFDSGTDERSVLIGVQPADFGGLGRDEVDLGSTNGTETLHANDCTVYTDVEGATLQVTVREGEADSDQCDTAQAIAQYVLPAVRH
ncbi:DUF3558 family protein [Parasphingorhabdus pacifica]